MTLVKFFFSFCGPETLIYDTQYPEKRRHKCINGHNKWSERKDNIMPRRGENIRKRADGRWEGRYVIYLPEKGKQQCSVYGKTYGEVKKKRSEAIEAINGRIPDQTPQKNLAGKK